jgi:hypothetical protein
VPSTVAWHYAAETDPVVGAIVLAGAAALLAPPDARPLIGALVLTTLPVVAVFGWYAYAG